MLTERAAFWFAVRTLTPGALILAAAFGLMIVVMVSTYSDPTPDPDASAASLSSLAENPAIRALYGFPYPIWSAGGVIVRRSGQCLAVIGALWAVLATTRILRGDEESGRWDLLLAAPITRERLTILSLGAVGLACMVQAVAAMLAFVAAGEPLVAGAFPFGVGLGLLFLDFAAVAALASQLFGQRRKAAGGAGAMLGAAFMARMIADSSDALGWMRWLTPFGWLEEIRPFAGVRSLPFLPLAVTPVVLGGIALFLASRRDLGEGIVRDPGTGPLRPALLRSAFGFSWRQRRSGALAWGAGLVAYGIVCGGITGVILEFFESNPSLQDVMARYGLESFASAGGFIASVDSFAALLLAFYVISSVHMLQEDEEEGRLDLIYAEPMSRRAWLQPIVVLSAVLAVAVAVAGAVAMWVGTVFGLTNLAFADSLVGMLNVLPIAALALGLAVLVYGLRPGWVVAVSGGAAAVTFIISFLGAALHLPNWALGLSPFHHLALAPAEPVAWVSTLVMVGIATALAAAGNLAFARRDMCGGVSPDRLPASVSWPRKERAPVTSGPAASRSESARG